MFQNNGGNAAHNPKYQLIDSITRRVRIHSQLKHIYNNFYLNLKSSWEKKWWFLDYGYAKKKYVLNHLIRTI